MSKILAFTGRKQSGKTSSAKFVVGQYVVGYELFPNCSSFSQNKDGDILLKLDNDLAMLPMKPNNENYEFYYNVLYPKIKIYSFATELKIAVVRIFNVPEEWVFGTEKDKNRLTKVKWNDFCKRDKNERVNPVYMTVREVLQEFGNFCREFKKDCWVQSTMTSLFSEYNIIDDLRYDNEAAIIKEKGGLIIKIEGGIEDSDVGEQGINPKFVDCTINRTEEGFNHKNAQILQFLKSKRFFVKD